MRFIHTADWHLGRSLYSVRLTDDQAYALDCLIYVARDAKPDVLIVSGDVYDRSVPPPEAVELLDDVFSKFVLDLRIPVICIAGNHDSAPRLEFGSRVMAGRNLHVFGTVSSQPPPVTFADRWGPVVFYPIPFGETSVLREQLACENIKDHNDALRELVQRIRSRRSHEERSVIVGHVFVAGGSESESERPLSIGGSDRVDPACFDGFNYAALGHLHRPQEAGTPRIRYPGSLLKYSFSEANHTKSIDVVEMDARGCTRVESVPILPRRDVRVISGYVKDILKGPGPGENREDYMMVLVQDQGPVLDLMGKLREVYPNCLHVERAQSAASPAALERGCDYRRMRDADLFALFFREVTGEELSEQEAEAYEVIADKVLRQEREVSSL